MKGDSKENILSVANSLVQEGKRAEAERLLNEFVSEMPIDWKPVTESETSIDVSYWSLEEFMSHAAHYTKEGGDKNLKWVVGHSYSEVFYTLAFISAEQQDWPKAMLYIQQAIELEPDHPLILCEKATILSQLGLYQKAYDVFKPKTVQSYVNFMEKAITVWGQRNIKTIGTAEVEDFLMWDHRTPKGQQISDKTRHNMKSCLHQFFSWVCRRDKTVEFPEFPEIAF